MNDKEIDRIIRECHYRLPVFIYAAICQSPKVDHIKRNDDFYDIWTEDGWHWRVTICL